VCVLFVMWRTSGESIGAQLPVDADNIDYLCTMPLIVGIVVRSSRYGFLLVEKNTREDLLTNGDVVCGRLLGWRAFICRCSRGLVLVVTHTPIVRWSYCIHMCC
jgi:hypothetical protein